MKKYHNYFLILDILLDKKMNAYHRNFKELNIHSIYCMDFDINKIDINNSIKLYQVSNIKSLKYLNRNLIEVDFGYMNKKCLNKI